MATSASKKSGFARGWKCKALPEFSAGESAIGEGRKQADLNGREQDLGAPKAKGRLQNSGRIRSCVHGEGIPLLEIASVKAILLAMRGTTVALLNDAA
ncbi:MAG: hypothetical protein QM706_17480 [Nitrospira sp.]